MRYWSIAVVLVVLSCGKPAAQNQEGPPVEPKAADAKPAASQDSRADEQHGKKQQKEKGGYETIFYPSGGLKIEGYLYKPNGDGPFPAIIYSHGARSNAKSEAPAEFVGDLLKNHGYVVLVAERRGYGKSDGDPDGEDDGPTEIVAKLQAGADDVIAGYDYLATLPYVDKQSVGLLGYSQGGTVTIFALAKSAVFHAGVDQATGALGWKKQPALHPAVADAASKIGVPLLSMDAKNDATNEPVTIIDAAMEKHHGVHKLMIYPPFTPPHEAGNTPPGHLIFTAAGVSIWKDDTVAWMDEHLKKGK